MFALSGLFFSNLFRLMDGEKGSSIHSIGSALCVTLFLMVRTLSPLFHDFFLHRQQSEETLFESHSPRTRNGLAPACPSEK